jgi:hypothetical protein
MVVVMALWAPEKSFLLQDNGDCGILFLHFVTLKSTFSDRPFCNFGHSDKHAFRPIFSRKLLEKVVVCCTIIPIPTFVSAVIMPSSLFTTSHYCCYFLSFPCRYFETKRSFYVQSFFQRKVLFALQQHKQKAIKKAASAVFQLSCLPRISSSDNKYHSDSILFLFGVDLLLFSVSCQHIVSLSLRFSLTGYHCLC